MAKELICPNCGCKGKPKKITKGSIFIEIILWIALTYIRGYLFDMAIDYKA
ncbi:MAG: hypothetical protein OES26_22550 [Gammaproteobacteria bacterium]|nr:hypothetical protein [Gammaproteobacteria bacterium]